jgi:ferredoxin/flavodoxin---NADP+ reductase
MTACMTVDTDAGQPLTNNKFSRETITWIQAVTPKLFRFRITRPAGFRFEAGQWARLGLAQSSASPAVWRAYSIASAPYDEHLEFYSIVVPQGEFTSALAQLQVGDAVLVDRQAFGFLTTARFQTAASGNDLWLLSTGTGLAPFISVLHTVSVWESYERIVVVHGVRESAELAYAEQIAALKHHPLLGDIINTHSERLIYQACISREPVAASSSALRGRITDLIINGTLEKHLGLTLEPLRSRVMICGNPAMVDDTRSALKARGLVVSRSAAPGQIAVENYW